MDQMTDLERTLALGPKKATELTGVLNISQPTLSRLLQKPSEKIRTFGKHKGAIYGLIRPILGEGHEFPFFNIDQKGEASKTGTITAIHERGFVWEPKTGAPKLYPGLPYFLSDLRPQGFLGKLFVKANKDLGFPERLQDWSENQIWIALVSRGQSLSGDLMIGEESFRKFLNEKKQGQSISNEKRGESFESLAEAADAGIDPGSSAAGEQPKFTHTIKCGSEYRPVIVKYSPPLNSKKGERWADLLISEKIALDVIRENTKIEAARTEIIESKKRIFLESTRFDRVGQWGRKGLISFAAIESEFIGNASNWAASAKDLNRHHMISERDCESIQWLDAFGSLIANTDRHYGNLSFYFDHETGKISLAPVYDMLPMYFSPIEREVDVFERTFLLPDPTADTLSHWKSAKTAAYLYWENIRSHSDISKPFKAEAGKVLRLFKK